MQQSTSPDAIDAAWEKGLAELEVVRRQSIIYTLYAPKEKSVMVRRAALEQRRRILLVGRDAFGPSLGGRVQGAGLLEWQLTCVARFGLTLLTACAPALQDMPLESLELSTVPQDA